MMVSLKQLTEVKNEYLAVKLSVFNNHTLPEVLDMAEFTDYFVAMNLWAKVIETKSIVYDLAVKHDVEGQEREVLQLIQAYIVDRLKTKTNLNDLWT